MAACGHGFAGTPVAHCGNVYPETAAAGLWSTPADLARLGIELSESLEGRSISVLNQATAELMLTKGRDDMGLGVGVHGEGDGLHFDHRSEEHTSELQSLMRISYAVFCLKKTHKRETVRCPNDPYIHIH